MIDDDRLDELEKGYDGVDDEVVEIIREVQLSRPIVLAVRRYVRWIQGEGEWDAGDAWWETLRAALARLEAADGADE